MRIRYTMRQYLPRLRATYTVTDLFFQQGFSAAKVLVALSVLVLLGYSGIVAAVSNIMVASSRTE